MADIITNTLQIGSNNLILQDAGARQDIATNTQDISDLKDGLSDVETALKKGHGINFVNLDEAVTGKLTSTGTVDASVTTYGTTGWIDVSDYVGKTLYIGRRVDSTNGVGTRTAPYLCTYDSQKNLVNYTSAWPSSVAITSGIAYVRYSLSASYFSKTDISRTGAFIDGLPQTFEDYTESFAIVDDVDAAKTIAEKLESKFEQSGCPDLEIGGISGGNPSTSDKYVRTKDFVKVSKGDVLTLSPTEFGVVGGAIYLYDAPFVSNYKSSVTIPTTNANTKFSYTFSNDGYFKVRMAKSDYPSIPESDLAKFEAITSFSHYYGYSDFSPFAKTEFELPLDYDSLAAAMDGKVCLAIQTDTHMSLFDNYTTAGQKYGASDFVTFRRVLASIEKLGVDAFANLGDIVRGYEFDMPYETRESLDTILDYYSDYISSPKLYVVGNHEDGDVYYYNLTYNDKQSVYDVLYPNEQFNRVTKRGIINKGLQNYYYVDISGIRVICLYQKDYDYSTEIPHTESFKIGTSQLEWLESTALDTDLPVLVITHAPLIPSLFSTSGTGFAEALGHIENFRTNGGKVIGVMTGHTHVQNSDTVNGITHVVFKNGSSFFELVTIDLEEQKVICSAVNNSQLTNIEYTF